MKCDWRQMQSIMATPPCILLVCVVAGINALEMSSCCDKATGSCRTVCEKMSLVEIAADATLHEDRVLNIYKFCQPELEKFWICMNVTLQAVVGGRGWWGRECCKFTRGDSCGRACATAANARDTSAACRASDELAFYQCVDKQRTAQECCSHTQSVECHEACRAALGVGVVGGGVRGARGRAAAACSPQSPRVTNCMRNLTRPAAAPATDPIRYLSCCDHSTRASCRESCLTILRTRTVSQDIVDSLQDGGCGPPLPQDAFWQCFLRKDSQAEQENEVGEINRMGIDSAKLHCCQKSATSHCKRLCFLTFTKDWIDHWARFDAECLKQSQQAALMQCVEEVDEPCELGCDGLSYCTNFNSRPTELFRACTARADLAAHLDVAAWQATGYFDLPGLKLPLRNTSQCSPQIWKAVACAVHVKPCSRQHSSTICREDCYELLAQCVDWSRVRGDFTAASLCGKLSADNTETPCISLRNFMEPSPAELAVQAYMSSPRQQVTFPCRGAPGSGPSHSHGPCNTSQVCAVSPPAHAHCHNRACDKYTCTDGCALGETSQFFVPRGTYVRIPINNSQKVCLKICQCSDSGAIDNCQPLPCFSYDSCQLVNQNIPHGRQFYMECNLCTCYGGEVVCARRSCTSGAGPTGPMSRARLPCQCAPHHLPVCAPNGKTYPNSCIAKCAGFTDADIGFGACSLHDPCSSELGRCAGDALCVPERAVCLSAMHAPCPQHVCVNISSCSGRPAQPACDSRGLTHPSACHLLASGHELAYRGPCRLGCRQKGRVCGSDGVTYDSECSALANLVSLDYLGPCLAVGSISDVVAAKCELDRIPCPALASPDCVGFTPPGACCPKCGGALRVLYSRKQIDRALYAMRGNALDSLTLKSILETLQRHIRTAECSVFGFLTIESEIFVSIESNVKNPSELQLKTCVSEAEKLSGLINGQSARIMSELSVSALSYAIEVHTFSTSHTPTFRDNMTVSLLVISFLMHLIFSGTR